MQTCSLTTIFFFNDTATTEIYTIAVTSQSAANIMTSTTSVTSTNASPTTTTVIATDQSALDSHSTIAMPAAQSPDNTLALIGGIVGGTVALLLVLGLIAFCVLRSRRSDKQQVAETENRYSQTWHTGNVPPNNYSDMHMTTAPNRYHILSLTDRQ